MRQRKIATERLTIPCFEEFQKTGQDACQLDWMLKGLLINDDVDETISIVTKIENDRAEDSSDNVSNMPPGINLLETAKSWCEKQC